jgi:hypothetical protein
MRLCADTTIYEHHRVCHHRFLRENFDDDVKTTEDTSIIKQGSDNGRIPHVSRKRLGHQIPTDHVANMALQAHVQGREVSILMLSYRHPATGDTIGQGMDPTRASHNGNFGRRTAQARACPIITY